MARFVPEFEFDDDPSEVEKVSPALRMSEISPGPVP